MHTTWERNANQYLPLITRSCCYLPKRTWWLLNGQFGFFQFPKRLYILFKGTRTSSLSQCFSKTGMLSETLKWSSVFCNFNEYPSHSISTNVWEHWLKAKHYYLRAVVIQSDLLQSYVLSPSPVQTEKAMCLYHCFEGSEIFTSRYSWIYSP